jgi:Xaa-Pro aminopeptidase
MSNKDLDALLVTSEANCIYFTGHETPGWVIKSRPHIFLLPLERDPVLLTALAAEAEKHTPIPDVRSYASSGFEPAAREMLADVLREAKLTRGRIGCEFGHEQRIGLSYADWRRLETDFQDAEWVDAGDLFWDLRMRKSPAELEYMRRAGQANAVAFRVLLPLVKLGMAERELHRLLAAALVDAGSERPGYVAMHSGPGNYNRVSSWPTNRVLQPGDLLFIDSGARCHGYWSDYGRTVAIGTSTPQQVHDYNLAYRSMQAALELVRPGIAVSKLWSATSAVLAAEGVSSQSSARVGHGLGLDLTEPPSILATESLLLEPGMVIAIEPRIDAEHGHFQTEENLVVTERGYELLSDAQIADLLVV